MADYGRYRLFMIEYVKNMLSIDARSILSEPFELPELIEKFPWRPRVDSIFEAYSNISPLEKSRIIQAYLVRDYILINYSSGLAERLSYSTTDLAFGSRPCVFLGVHDFCQVFTANYLASMFQGIRVLAEDLNNISEFIRPLFYNSYQRFEEKEEAPIIVEVGGFRSPMQYLQEAIDNSKSIYATIDVFPQSIKSTALVKGKYRQYCLAKGVVDMFRSEGYDFYFVSGRIKRAGISHDFYKLSGETTSQILESYISRLETLIENKFLLWEGFSFSC